MKQRKSSRKRAFSGPRRNAKQKPKERPRGQPGAPIKAVIAQEIRMEFVNIADLHPHPRNYREHPEDQVSHLEQSIKENGFYRNVVITSDDVINETRS